MNANDNNSRESQADVIELGVASVETKGELIGVEFMGDDPTRGISEQ